MPSYVSSSGESDFTPIAAGTYLGRCYQVVNLGVHAAGPWAPKSKHYIAFEIPAERVTWTDKENVDHEGPAIIGSRYTSSLSPKATLRQQLESWRGALFTDAELQQFDLFHLIGVPAMISVVHSEDGKFANITGIMRLPQGVVCPPAELEPITYDPSDPNAAASFEKLTNRMQETVTKGHAPVGNMTRAAPPQAGLYVPPPMGESPTTHPVPAHQEPRSTRGPAMPPNGHAPQHAPQHAPPVDDFDDDIPF